MTFDIYVTVRDTRCSAVLASQIPITTGCRGEFRAVLHQDESWADLDKTVVFRAGRVERSQHIGTGTECLVPPEVLSQQSSAMEIGVYGTIGGDVVRTTTFARVSGVFQGARPTDDPTESPDLYAQLIEQFRAGVDAVSEAAELAGQAAESSTQSASQACNSATVAEQARASAESYAMHPPVIGEDGLWYLWDGTQYVATDNSSSGLPDVVSVSGTELALSLENNTEYRCTDAVTSLEITGFAAGVAGKAELWGVVFTAGDTITVALPDTVVWAVAEPVFTAGSTYWISVVPMGGKYLAAWTEVEA